MAATGSVSYSYESPDVLRYWPGASDAIIGSVFEGVCREWRDIVGL
jgi:hypothetical protein